MQKTIRSFLYLLIVTGLIFSACAPEPEPMPLPEPEPTPMPTENDSATGEDTVYADGTYNAEGTYVSPAGPESVGVSLTVENDVIVAVNIQKNASNETSQMLQGLFSDGVGDVVVGVRLDELKDLGPTNGSSLTPKGFNEALALIKAEALIQ